MSPLFYVVESRHPARFDWQTLRSSYGVKFVRSGPPPKGISAGTHLPLINRRPAPFFAAKKRHTATSYGLTKRASVSAIRNLRFIENCTTFYGVSYVKFGVVNKRALRLPWRLMAYVLFPQSCFLVGPAAGWTARSQGRPERDRNLQRPPSRHTGD